LVNAKEAAKFFDTPHTQAKRQVGWTLCCPVLTNHTLGSRLAIRSFTGTVLHTVLGIVQMPSHLTSNLT